MSDVDIKGACAHVGLRHVRNLHTSLSKFIVSLLLLLLSRFSRV